MRPRVCSQKPDLARKRRKPKQALSTEVEIFSRDVSASLRGGSISPGARAALVALIGTLAELLGESPLTT